MARSGIGLAHSKVYPASQSRLSPAAKIGSTAEPQATGKIGCPCGIETGTGTIPGPPGLWPCW